MFDVISFLEGLTGTIIVETIVILLISEPLRQRFFRQLSRAGNWLTNPVVEAVASRVLDVEGLPADIQTNRPNQLVREQVASTLKEAALAPGARVSRTVEFEVNRRGSHFHCTVSCLDEDPADPVALKVSLRVRVGYRTVARDLFSTVGIESTILEALTSKLHLRPRGWGLHIEFPDAVRPMAIVDPDMVEYVSGRTLDKEIVIKVGPRSIDAEGPQGESLERLLKVVIARAPRGVSGP